VVVRLRASGDRENREDDHDADHRDQDTDEDLDQAQAALARGAGKLVEDSWKTRMAARSVDIRGPRSGGARTCRPARAKQIVTVTRFEVAVSTRI